MDKISVITADGSSTLFIPEWNESYHSRHGAIAESNHVFVENGIASLTGQRRITILEVGFGTGLNALLTYIFACRQGIATEYHAIEPHPLNLEDCEKLNYTTHLQDEQYEDIFIKMHQTNQGRIQLDANFVLIRHACTLKDFDNKEACNADLVYYDAFGPRVQPEMWKEHNLVIVADALKPGGILVTYCAQGAFRRSLRNLFFSVEKLEGPPGKREMTRATKISH